MKRFQPAFLNSLKFRWLLQGVTQGPDRSAWCCGKASLDAAGTSAAKQACQGIRLELRLSLLGWFSSGRSFAAPFVE
jgi:hypothetical protein